MDFQVPNSLCQEQVNLAAFKATPLLDSVAKKPIKFGNLLLELVTFSMRL